MPHSALEVLSPRELQVLRMVAEGKTSKEIAVMLDLREQTVRSYRKTMMKKLGVNNVAGLTQLALSTGLDAGCGVRPCREPNSNARSNAESPWGPLAVADAHVHFFSHRFFASLAAQKPGLTLEAAGEQLGLAPAAGGAGKTRRDLGRRAGPARRSTAALIASVPGDEASVTAAVRAFPDRFFAFAMVNPRGVPWTAPDGIRNIFRDSTPRACSPPCTATQCTTMRRRPVLRMGRRTPPRRLCPLRRAERRRARQARPAVAVRHAIFESHRPARRRAALSVCSHRRAALRRRAIFAKR